MLPLWCLGSLSWAKGVNPDSLRQATWQQFQGQYGPEWQIRWGKYTGLPESILGDFLPPSRGTPDEIARSFLQAHHQLFGIADVNRDLRLDRERFSERGGTRLQYQQYYQGIPVLYSGYLVAVHTNGSIYYLSGDYYPDLTVDTQPTLTPTSALAIIQADLAGASLQILSEPQISIYVSSEQDSLRYHLVYQTQVQGAKIDEAWEYLVDAHTGHIHRKVSLIEHINGSGSVYVTNPNHGSPVTRTLHRLRDLSPPKVRRG